MIVAWIVVTLMIAVVLGGIMAGVQDYSDERLPAFFVTGYFVCVLSFFIGVIYVASHFIGKYW